MTLFGKKQKPTRRAQVLRCESLEDRRLLAVVTSAADSGPGTLRDALAGPDPTITFDVAAMGSSTITLTSGQLLVDRDVAIDGDDGSGGRVTIDGGGTYRGFYMTDYNNATYLDQSISNLIITNGYTYSDGGGIQSFENLTLDNVTIDSNYSLNDAGGLGFGDEGNGAGDLVITNSEITNNFARDDGGGLDFYNALSLTMTNSDLSGNTIGDPLQANFAGAKVGGGARLIDLLGLHPTGQTITIQDSNIDNNVVQGQMSGGVDANGNPVTPVTSSGAGIIFVNLTEDSGTASLPQTVLVERTMVSGNTDDLTDLDGLGSVADPNNDATPDGSGGGFDFSGATDITLNDVTFDGNYAYANSSGVNFAGGYGQTGAALGSNITAVLNNVTITNHGEGPRMGLPALGGAFGAIEYSNVYIDLDITINDSTITGNSAQFGAGVLTRQGVNLTVNNSDISNNYALGSGGGLYVLGFGETATVTVNDTTIADNTATFNGAGILLRDNTPYATTFNLNNSTVSGNVGIGDTSDPAYQDLGDGGGIFNNGILMNIAQSTISNNISPTNGGGIYVEYIPQDASIVQSTIIGNTADGDNAGAGNGNGVGGGISLAVGNFYKVNVSNSVISGNQDTTGANDLDDVGTGYLDPMNSYVGGSPMLGALGNNGGNTLTHAPMAGSPLIDAGDNGLAPFATDQTGAARVNGAAVDLGSVEYGSMPTNPYDFTGDGNAFCEDLDLLTMESGAGTNNPMFDLTNDGLVNNADVQAWLVGAGAQPENAAVTNGNAFLVGDADCNGSVDGADFIAWNGAKFTTNTKWTMGNFNGDGATDGADFIAWNTNKFMSSSLMDNNDGGSVGSNGNNFALTQGNRVGDRVNVDRLAKRLGNGEAGQRAVFAAPAAVTEFATDAKVDLGAEQSAAVATPQLTRHQVAQAASDANRTQEKVDATEAIDMVFSGKFV